MNIKFLAGLGTLGGALFGGLQVGALAQQNQVLKAKQEKEDMALAHDALDAAAKCRECFYRWGHPQAMDDATTWGTVWAYFTSTSQDLADYDCRIGLRKMKLFSDQIKANPRVTTIVRSVEAYDLLVEFPDSQMDALVNNPNKIPVQKKPK